MLIMFIRSWCEREALIWFKDPFVYLWKVSTEFCKPQESLHKDIGLRIHGHHTSIIYLRRQDLKYRPIHYLVHYIAKENSQKERERELTFVNFFDWQ